MKTSRVINYMEPSLNVPLVGPGEVARLLGVTVRIVRNMRLSGAIPHVKLTNHSIRYDMAAVLEAIRQKQESDNE